MDPWVWLAAYLVGFTLLQVLLYRRFRQDVPRGGGDTTPAGAESPAPRATPDGDSTGDTVVCRTCGTRNESAAPFSYCRQCCDPLQ